MLWITLCLVPTLVAAEDQLSAVEQQRRQLTSVDIQPPAHVIYGLLVEPWLNSSSRHARRLPEEPQPAGNAAALTDRRQALVAVAVVSAALERADTDAADRLRRVLAEYDSAPADQQLSLLNSSLAELAERLHAPVIRLEALLIAQQAQLEAVAGAVAALPDSSDAHDAITRFVNSVTATVGRRVSEAEVTINRLSDSLRQLNESIASDRPTKPDRSEKEADPVPATPGRCCDQLEARLARLEAAAADRDQLAERLDAALARLRDLEERQMLLPRPSPAVQRGWQPAGSVEKEQDLSTAGSERLDTLVVGRSASAGEQDIITADSLVTADDLGAQVVLGRSIQVADSTGARTRSGLPPQTPVASGRSLHSLLLGGGTPDRPDTSGWRPLNTGAAAERRSRLLPASGGPGNRADERQPVSVEAGDSGETADTASETSETPSNEVTPNTADPTETQSADNPVPAEASARAAATAAAAGDQTAQPSELSPAVAAAGVAPRRGRPAGPSVSRPQSSSVSRPRSSVSRPPPSVLQPPQPVAQSRQGRIGPDLGTAGYVRVSGRPFQCQPTALYVRLPGMYEWCQFNCPIYCPPSHCRCQGFRG
ncbi:actin cytoskeleton-regulatory complex protein PAN1-like [Amphibalanus amphitrite]|uniref:actin cytoskeleton-regulatory complex protein PAN1-like n=1 Tax=Amphibalanus amphitrite TaxID=1232801 RepID=UPI001C919FF4|nr:actin cytoskeleton-regulatory complex protein PAN1-like [Amphibalanus amphitrite]